MSENWFEGSWYDVPKVHALLMYKRHNAAANMARDIADGNEGIAAMAEWKVLDEIIHRLDAKKPAAGAPATDSDSATEQK